MLIKFFGALGQLASDIATGTASDSRLFENLFHHTHPEGRVLFVLEYIWETP